MVSLEERCSQLRTEIKEWEYAFRQEHQRAPGKEDIRSSDIRRKYKKYNVYKEELRRRQMEAQNRTPKKTRKLEVTEGEESKDKPIESGEDDEDEESEEEEITEIGPTPRLEGRILGLFESMTPTKSPNGITESPSKKVKLELEATPSKKTPKKHIDEAKPGPELSPSKSPMTPAYLRFHNISASPVKRKGLSSLIAEFKQIQQTPIEEEFEEIIQEVEDNPLPDLGEEFEEIEQPQDGEKEDTQWKQRFKKKPKRTTRRHVFKAVLNDEDIAKGVQLPTPKTPKETPNLVRLKLNNSGYKGKPRFFGRRSR
uniref:DNA replication regulator SLD2 n=1 Tax=Blastobotrys adeninivorans TaxID=409370 RepID=A0A060TBU0_BLAAD